MSLKNVVSRPADVWPRKLHAVLWLAVLVLYIDTYSQWTNDILPFRCHSYLHKTTRDFVFWAVHNSAPICCLYLSSPPSQPTLISPSAYLVVFDISPSVDRKTSNPDTASVPDNHFSLTRPIIQVMHASGDIINLGSIAKPIFFSTYTVVILSN